MQTILYHAKLYVARGDFRSALCAEDGIIRAVGSDAEILALARPGCRRIDCEGRAVVPASTTAIFISCSWRRRAMKRRFPALTPWMT